MPRVPLEPLPGARLSPISLPVGPETFGAGIGQAVEQVSSDFMAEIDKKKKEAKAKADALAVLSADNQMAAWQDSYLRDPKTGKLTTTKGPAAAALPSTVGTDFDQQAGKARQALVNDDQRLQFDEQSSQRRASVMRETFQYTDSEMKQYAAQQADSGLANASQAAVVAAGNNDLPGIGQALAKGQQIIAQQAVTNGWDSDTTQAKLDEFRSNTHYNAIDRYLADGKDQTAKAYYDKFKAEIDGTTQTKIEGALKVGSTRGESQRQASQILTDYDQTVRGGNKPPTQSELDEKLSKISDPDLQDAVRERVERGVALRKEEARQTEEENNKQAVKTAKSVFQRDASIVEKQHALDSIPPGDWAELTPEMQENLMHLADTLAKGKEVKTDFRTYDTLSTMADEDPNAFAREDLNEYITRLSTDDLKHFDEVKSRIKSGDFKAASKLTAEYREPKQVVDDALRDDLHINLASKVKADRDRIDAFRQAVVVQVKQFEQATKKQATKDDIKGIVDGLVIQGTVGQPGAIWGTNQVQKYSYELMDTDKLKLGDVEIPRSDVLRYVFMLDKNGIPVNDGNIITAYKKDHGGQ